MTLSATNDHMVSLGFAAGLPPTVAIGLVLRCSGAFYLICTSVQCLILSYANTLGSRSKPLLGPVQSLALSSAWY